MMSLKLKQIEVMLVPILNANEVWEENLLNNAKMKNRVG